MTDSRWVVQRDASDRLTGPQISGLETWLQNVDPNEPVMVPSILIDAMQALIEEVRERRSGALGVECPRAGLWVVPVIPGPIDESVIVEVHDIDRVRVVYTVGHQERALPVLPSLIACQVGQALQDAGRYCGELRDAAAARRVAEMKRSGQRGPRKRASGVA
jgi:hypothetical protein